MGSTGSLRRWATAALAVVWTAAGFLAGVAAAAPADLPLAEAVRAGDLEQVRTLVAGDVDVNAADGDGATALHWAALNDDVEIGRALIAAGADVDAATRFDATPIALAAENASVAFLTLLLDAGADPDWANPEGETLLMTVARTGRTEAVRRLLDAGADPNPAESWRGQTALMWASAENRLDTAETLIDAGADIHERSAGSLGFSPLLFAVRAGHLEMSRLLIDAGANPDETLLDGTSALVLATKNGHYELGALLLDEGADPNADDNGWTALHEIKWTRRPNLGFNNPPPVVTGTMTDLEFVRKLVDHGADLNARMTKEPNNRYRNVLNRIGSTPFLLAAKGADVEMMRLLVGLGADPRIPNEDGTTPLMVAAGVGIWAVGESPGTNEEALEAVRYALELGSDATAIDDNGDTALHGAIIRGSEPLVRFLLERGADIEATNEKGWTPLRIAKGVFYSNTGKRWPEMEALLLELGADPSTATGADNTIDWTLGDRPR